MKVLGIDPGSQVMGWGVVERKGNRIVGIAASTLRLGTSAKPLEARLRLAFEGLSEVVALHAPQVVAVEDIFYAKYPAAAIKLGHVRGVALLVAANAELKVFSYSPALVKRTVAGRGQADKQQVARLVGAILGLRELPALDATDALAIAITHAQATLGGMPATPGRSGRSGRSRA